MLGTTLVFKLEMWERNDDDATYMNVEHRPGQRHKTQTNGIADHACD